MTYQEFQDEIIALLSEKLPSNITIQPNIIKKNNSTEVKGIIIKNPDLNIAPNIYLEYYYHRYCHENNLSIDSIISSLLETYNDIMPVEDFDYNTILDFDIIKHHITYRLINYSKNESLLKETPHIKYLDLAIVFYCLIGVSEEGTSSVLIKNTLMQTWGTDTNQLFQIASKNTPHLQKADIKSVQNLLINQFEDSHITQDDLPSEEEVPMYVLTNSTNLYGASAILYQNILQEFANKCSTDLVIIPSSVHEVLLIPSNIVDSLNNLKDLISYVNSTSLETQDILSDQPYYYSRETNDVSCLSY